MKIGTAPCSALKTVLIFGSVFIVREILKVKESEVVYHVRSFATPWTVAYQAPPSMGSPWEILRQYHKPLPLRLLFLLLVGSLCPSILLLDTVEDPGHFATIESLHEPAGHELARDE